MPTRPGLEPPRGNPRFPNLDGVRGLGALAVIFVHVLVPGITRSADPEWVRGVYTLRIWVALFFLLSGFLLYRPFVLARVAGAPRPSARVFWWRRILRVVPGYWVALTLLAIWPGLPGVFGHDGWRYYTFVYIYTQRTVDGGLVPAWTLCVDMTYYLALPFFAWGMNRLWLKLGARRAVQAELTLFLVVCVATAVYWGVLISGPHLSRTAMDVRTSNLIANLDWLVMGMGLAVLSVSDLRRTTLATRLLSRRYGLLAAWGVAGLAFVVMSNRIFTISYAAQHVLAGLVCLAVFAPAVLTGDRRIARHVLANPVIAWIGLISYGAYLYHGPLIYELHHWGIGSGAGFGPYLELLGATVAVSLAVGALSYYIVELPFLRRKRRDRSSRTDSAPATGEKSR